MVCINQNRIFFCTFIVMIFFCFNNLALADLDDFGDLETKPEIKATPTPLPLPTTSPSGGVKPTPTPDQTSHSDSNIEKVSAEQDEKDRKQPIFWSATGLSGSKENKKIILKDQVKIKQGSMNMSSNMATIYFNDADEIERVEAEGRVRFSRDLGVESQKVAARGKKAVFYSIERQVILSGSPTLIRGSSNVYGKEIHYSLDSGKVKVDKVSGVFEPTDIEKTTK